MLYEELLNMGLVTHFLPYHDFKNPNSKLKIRNSKYQKCLR